MSDSFTQSNRRSTFNDIYSNLSLMSKSEVFVASRITWNGFKYLLTHERQRSNKICDWCHVSQIKRNLTCCDIDVQYIFHQWPQFQCWKASLVSCLWPKIHMFILSFCLLYKVIFIIEVRGSYAQIWSFMVYNLD